MSESYDKLNLINGLIDGIVEKTSGNGNIAEVNLDLKVLKLENADSLAVPVCNIKWHHEDQRVDRPLIVCLCGSTKFYKEFMDANYKETMKGNIVLSVGFFSQTAEEAHGEKIGIRSEERRVG